jgi:hypothetical protein
MGAGTQKVSPFLALAGTGDRHSASWRLQVHLVQRQGHQQRTHIRERFDPMSLGAGQDAETDRRGLTALVTPDK